MKIAKSKANQIISICLAVVIIFILSGATYFIYQNVYQTIILLPQLQEMKNQISYESVKIDLFNQVSEKIDKKVNATSVDWTKIKSPF